LIEVWITTFVPVDEKRSSIRVVRSCKTCGRIRHTVEGVESITSRYDPQAANLKKIHDRRKSGAGVYVDAKQATKAGMFRVRAVPWWILCTDRVREGIEEKRLTNVAFLEVGEGT